MTFQISFLNALMSSVLVMWAAGSAMAESPRPVANLVGPWQLFIDDHVVADSKNVLRRHHQFQKYSGNPLIVVDRPWETNVVNFCTVLPGEDGTGFRMYYYCWTGSETAKTGEGSFLCYATSKDGVTWEKPNLGLYKWPGDGTTNNNIIRGGASAVMHTPWSDDPERQYHGVGGQYYARVSADGLRWKQLSDDRIVNGGDTSHFYWDPNTKLFRCNVKLVTDVIGLRRRCVGFSETDNLTKFPSLRLVMAPDEFDDLWCKPGTAARTHFYACPVIPYESMYLGLLQVYRAEEPEGYFHGPLWLELVSSRDGQHWNRAPVDTEIRDVYSQQDTSRPPVLNIGKYRQFDHGMAVARPPVMVGDEIWLYYTGYDEDHDLLPYKSAIGLAKMRKDGFVSLDADEAPGVVLTKKFGGVGGPMKVNYNARGGSLRVEILDADGNVIPSYGRDDCEPLTGDGVREVVTWKNRETLPASQDEVRIRFLMNHVRLYSFMVGDDVRVIDEPAEPVLQILYTFEGNVEAFSDMLWADGSQQMRRLGTCKLDHKKPDPAFGKRSLVVSSPWRPWNRVEIDGTRELGRRFTLAAMVKSTRNTHARLFSAYRGNYPTNTSELIFDFDPAGRKLDGMRLFCKGIAVESDPVKFDDGEYHHLAVAFDDGEVNFHLDGKRVGQRWLPGGDPVSLARNLLVGEDAEMGTDEQLHGHVDDVLVLGRAMSAEEIAALAEKGATAFFGLAK